MAINDLKKPLDELLIELERLKSENDSLKEQLIKDKADRFHSEKIYRDSQLKFQNLVDSTNGIVWEGDAQTFQFTYVSKQAERLLGYSVEDWYLPGFWTDHLFPDGKEDAINYCVWCTSQMIPHDFEYRFIAKDGRVVWLRDIVNVVVEDSKPKWLRGLMVDITDGKRAEQELSIYRAHLEDLVKIRTEELAKANNSLLKEIEKQKEFEILLQLSLEKEKELHEMKSKFISTTSHEFRTPLTSILSSAGLLQRYITKWNEEKKNEHLNRIQKSVGYLTNLLDDILTIGRMSRFSIFPS